VRGAAQACSLVMLGLLFATVAASTPLLASTPFYLGCLAALMAGSAICLFAAQRRFHRLPS